MSLSCFVLFCFFRLCTSFTRHFSCIGCLTRRDEGVSHRISRVLDFFDFSLEIPASGARGEGRQYQHAGASAMETEVRVPWSPGVFRLFRYSIPVPAGQLDSLALDSNLPIYRSRILKQGRKN